jgi:predicted Zn-dependent protease
MKLDSSDLALYDFRRALKKKPTDESLRIYLSNTLFKFGKYEEVIEGEC